MEYAEKTINVINDLIKINNDRVEGFEKAGKDLEGDDSGLITVFNKLAGESQQNVAELTAIAQQYGGEAAEGTSTSGDLHRAWIDIKSTFTGSDTEAILNECERGEDAIKSAYRSVLYAENELDTEVMELLQRQQVGIIEGHDLIKSLRDQVKATDEGEDQFADTTTAETSLLAEDTVEQPSYEGAAGKYGQKTAFIPESETLEQEEAYREEEYEENSTGNSKLSELFINELKDLLWAERELVDTLPDMVEAASSEELKRAFTNHLAETETHAERLEQIFGILGLEPDTKKCDAMSGILDEGDEIISDTEEGTAQRDVGLILAGQKVEHYEIASYGGMISMAKTLGYYEIAEILALTIEEEKAADALLTEIAENHINYDAANEPAED